MFPNDDGIFESCVVKTAQELSGTGPNPYFQGLIIRDKDDLFPKAFSVLELNNVYAGLCGNNHDEGMICECPSLEEFEYYNPGTEEVPDSFILEAITVDKFSRTEKRMAAVVRTFNKHLADSEIKALQPVVGKPKKSGTFAYVAVQLPFSDGQTVNVIFHSPEGDKKQIGANDSIIAFRWLLNKRDITQVVAPEDGAEVSLETIAKRITQLVVKNSARFEKQQKAAQAERQELDKAREDVKAAEDKQRELMDNVASAVKETEGIEAQLANTLSLLEKQKVINAELQARLDALKKAKGNGKGTGAGNTGNRNGNNGGNAGTTTDLTELRAQIESWKNTLAEIEKGILSPQHVLGYRGSKKEARRFVNYEIERVEKQIEILEKELVPPKEMNENRLTVIGDFPSGAIKGDSNKEAVRLAQDWVENHIHEPAHTAIGDVIVNRAGIKNSFGHGISQAKLDAIPAIIPLLEKGNYLGAMPDKDGKPIDNHYFAGKVVLGGEEKVIFARVRKAAGDDNRFYVHDIFTEEEIKKTIDSSGTRNTTPDLPGTTAFYKNLIVDYMNVNGGDSLSGSAGTPSADQTSADGQASSTGPRGDVNMAPPPAFVNDLNDILAGKYDADWKKIGPMLDDAYAEAEKASLAEQYDALFSQAADHLTKVMKKSREGK